MARTVTEIYNSLINKKAEYTALDAMNSTSSTAIFKLLAYVFAYVAWTVETIFDIFQAEVNEKLKLPAHNERWYQQAALAYQHGDELVWDELLESFTYLSVDESKKIVARAACVEIAGRVLVKAVKETNGVLQPLTTAENDGLQAYLNRVKDAGVRISSRSWLPDDLVITYIIIYDPLLLNSTGGLLSSPSTKPVEDAIDAYIELLDFNGRFSISKLEDAIQAASGVVDFNRGKIESRHGADGFTTISVDRVAESGYMKLHENSSILYTASNV